MPVLSSQPLTETAQPIARRASRTFPICANPRCTSGWLQLWRKRHVPVVEGGWLCSPACTRARIEDLLRREQAEANPVSSHRHRVPIGLILLTQGFITHDHLKDALSAQRSGANMRLGEWLVAHRGLDEGHLTQALALQWSCPAFTLETHAAAAPVSLVPQILAESFGFVPLRLTSSGILYLAFEDRIDHSLTLAIERMTGLRVESGLLSTSDFRLAQQQLRRGRLARIRMVEAGNIDLLAETLTRHIEKEKPTEARIVRLHDLFWLRLWRQSEGALSMPDSIQDIVASVVRFV